MNIVDVTQGDTAIVLGQPHAGTWMPENIAHRLNAQGQQLKDTDWHIPRLYENLLQGATIVTSNVHRYVIDANRNPQGHSLYPGQNTTGLVPLTDFEGRPIWRPGQEPDEDDMAERCSRFHQPYHDTLKAELERIKARHGIVVLFDCHSIRSRLPYLFKGELPVFNIGSNEGISCDHRLESIVESEIRTNNTYSSVLNGRFKGGWTTRHYGQPQDKQHAIQLEIAQRAYMQEFEPWTWHDQSAHEIRQILQIILHRLNHLALSGVL